MADPVSPRTRLGHPIHTERDVAAMALALVPFRLALFLATVLLPCTMATRAATRSEASVAGSADLAAGLGSRAEIVGTTTTYNGPGDPIPAMPRPTDRASMRRRRPTPAGARRSVRCSASSTAMQCPRERASTATLNIGHGLGSDR